MKATHSLILPLQFLQWSIRVSYISWILYEEKLWRMDIPLKRWQFWRVERDVRKGIENFMTKLVPPDLFGYFRQQQMALSEGIASWYLATTITMTHIAHCECSLLGDEEVFYILISPLKSWDGIVFHIQRLGLESSAIVTEIVYQESRITAVPWVRFIGDYNSS